MNFQCKTRCFKEISHIEKNSLTPDSPAALPLPHADRCESFPSVFSIKYYGILVNATSVEIFENHQALEKHLNSLAWPSTPVTTGSSALCHPPIPSLVPTELLFIAPQTIKSMSSWLVPL